MMIRIASRLVLAGALGVCLLPGTAIAQSPSPVPSAGGSQVAEPAGDSSETTPASEGMPLPTGSESLAPEPAALPPAFTTSQGEEPAGASGAGATAGPPADAAAEPAPPATSVAIAPDTLPRDLSPWGMFAAADRVVQLVMIGLAFASLVTWTVCIVKGIEITLARWRLLHELKAIRTAHGLTGAEEQLAGKRGVLSRLIAGAFEEFARSEGLTYPALMQGIKDRIADTLSRHVSLESRRMGRGTGVLATIGATAPFVGLFGTVWGIMNSFIGISEAQTTNLAIVAPGIAEALLATAFGLVAAIPAVVIYNLFARWIAAYRALLGDASSEVLQLVSRDLDRRVVAGMHRQAAA